MKEIQLPYGIQGNMLRHISEVNSGLVCDCVCPSCSMPLVARKGEKVQHHFSHQALTSCSGATETALHLAAKDILGASGKITLPAIEIKFNTYRESIEISPPREFTVTSIQVEKRAGNITPDLIAMIEGQELFIEIFVTHPVDQAKLQKIRELGISAIEIDLSEAPRDLSIDSIQELVVTEHKNKRWLYNSFVDYKHKAMLAASIRRPIVHRGLALHIDDCPIQSRVWHGKPYANVIDDCLFCDHHLEQGENNDYIYCNGHLPSITKGT